MAKKKTHEQFIEEVYDLVGNEYTILGRYIRSNIKLDAIHNKCGHAYSVRPDKILIGRRCPKCAGNQQSNTEEFKQLVFKAVQDEYSVIGEYKKSRLLLDMQHNTCGRIFKMRPNDFQSGRRCPHCHGKFKKSPKEFVDEVCNLVGDEYSVLQDYDGAHAKIDIKHNECGYAWSIAPTSFLGGTRCPRCTVSKGEDGIQEWLSDNNIPYIAQYTFEDCKNVFELPFDFAIFDDNKSLKMLIEYDGEQHFKPVQFGGMSYKRAQDNYKRCVHNDIIKNTYCKDNNIELLRIPYTKLDNLENTLSTNVS